MEYTKLGRTGLDVSRICLVCMSYGGGNRGNHAWSLSEEGSKPFIKKGREAGLNFFDPPNPYSPGNREERPCCMDQPVDALIPCPRGLMRCGRSSGVPA